MPTEPHGQMELKVLENEVPMALPPLVPHDRDNVEVDHNQGHDQAVGRDEGPLFAVRAMRLPSR